MEFTDFFWDRGFQIVTLIVAIVSALGTVGFFRKEKITRGENYTLKLERDDLRKKLARAEVRLDHVDPERFLDKVSELEQAGKFKEAAESAEEFGKLQSVAFGCAAVFSTEDAIINADGERLDVLEDAVRFVSIGLAADPENKRLIALSEEVNLRFSSAKAGDNFETLPIQGMKGIDLHQLALKLHAEGRFVLAELVSRRAMPLILRSFGPISENYAKALGVHGSALDELGQTLEAERTFHEAIDVAKKAIGTDHSDYAIHVNNLAFAIHKQGRLSEAEALFREALEIDKRTVGTMHSNYAIRLNNLAYVLKDQGKYNMAERYLSEALKIDEETVGTNSSQYAKHLHNLAGLLEVQGRFSDAEKLARKAITKAKSTIGVDHPNFANHLNDLAAILMAQGHYAEAEVSYDRALKIVQTQLGLEHPTTKLIQTNLDKLLAQKPYPDTSST